MRRAVAASVLVHAGAIGAAWVMLTLEPPEDPFSAESVSIEIITMESAITSAASEIVTEATQTLVSAGSATPAAETVEAEPVEVMETAALEPAVVPPPPPAQAQAQAAAPPIAPSEAEAVASAEVLTATTVQPIAADMVAPLPAGEATEVAAAIAAAPADPREQIAQQTRVAELTPADPIAPLPPAALEPVKALDPIETASLGEALEPLPDETVPVPRPRLARQAVPPAKEPAPRQTQKPAEAPAKPAPTRQASLGSGGAAEADSAARAASGGRGSTDSGGSAATSKYPGLVQARVTRAARYPANAKGAAGEAQVSFTVAADGRVQRIALARSSGNAELDAAALAAVERAAPFPAIPPDANRSSWPFTVPLMFRR